MSTKKHDNVYDHERRPSSNEQKNNKEDSQAKFYLCCGSKNWNHVSGTLQATTA